MKLHYYRNSELLNAKSKVSHDAPLIVNLVNDCFTNFEPFSYDTYNNIGRDDYFLIYVTHGVFNTKIDDTVLEETPLEDNITKYLCVHFAGSHAEKILTDLEFPLEPYILEGDFSPKIKSLFDKMVEKDITKAPFLQYSLACLLEEILLTIAVERVRNSGYRTFKNSIKYIHANYTEKIKIPYLAQLEGLSNSRYITLFSKEMGKTPSEYILSLRLGRACDLLSTTNMEISAVGASSGYNDQYFFSKIFKKHMGMSPQEYGKRYK